LSFKFVIVGPYSLVQVGPLFGRPDWRIEVMALHPQCRTSDPTPRWRWRPGIGVSARPGQLGDAPQQSLANQRGSVRSPKDGGRCDTSILLSIRVSAGRLWRPPLTKNMDRLNRYLYDGKTKELLAFAESRKENTIGYGGR
jgi:hypothetical protein